MAKEALNKKERIDVVLVQRGLVPSRERARALIPTLWLNPKKSHEPCVSFSANERLSP